MHKSEAVQASTFTASEDASTNHSSTANPKGNSEACADGHGEETLSSGLSNSQSPSEICGTLKQSANDVGQLGRFSLD